ncbi:YgaP family membrane protein [Raineyella fluvialis]|uniref:DUF2892 domain-containing protein n=1 Tax=Raineyella fluvialis TaxID=2662261 RepID=A0A5Q2FDF9_9ACTN|nr:DUF2892 domain-containing protein [Raineyella fluvialis]QGF24798.1 DUF2892 domain-containing protein [Raineyella fluvialis]
MIKNIGSTDRLIRFILGPILIVLAYILGFTSVLGIVAVIVGLLLIGTASISTCPLYLALHLSTAPKTTQPSSDVEPDAVH